MSLRVRPLSTTFISEPNPRMFGNDANPVPPPATWSKLSTNWLRSRFHFSFAEWSRGPRNFGVLRVMNDDLVQPLRMFGAHPHGDMEIATYVVSGKLTHWHMDRSGGGAHETLGRGSLQFMTAGTGVTHTEGNDSDEPLRFIQMWIVPRQRGLKPNYGSINGAERKEKRLNQWDHLLADINAGEMLCSSRINQDCNIFVSEIDRDVATGGLGFSLKAGRQAYVLNIEGEATITTNSTDCPTASLATYESATATGPLELKFTPAAAAAGAAEQKSHVLIVEMELATA